MTTSLHRPSCKPFPTLQGPFQVVPALESRNSNQTARSSLELGAAHKETGQHSGLLLSLRTDDGFSRMAIVLQLLILSGLLCRMTSSMWHSIGTRRGSISGKKCKARASSQRPLSIAHLLRVVRLRGQWEQAAQTVTARPRRFCV